MLQGIKIDERYNGRYIPELIQDQLMYVSNTKIEVDHGTHRSFDPFSCIRYLNRLNCWVLARHGFAYDRTYFEKKTTLSPPESSVSETIDVRHLPSEAVAYLYHKNEEILKHNETPSTPLNDLPNKKWFVGRDATFRNRSDKRIVFEHDDDVKVTEAPEPRGTVHARDFLHKASEKRVKKAYASRRKKRGNEITDLRTRTKMDVDEHEKFGGSISKSSRYTKKSKTAKKRKNKRKTMRH